MGFEAEKFELNPGCASSHCMKLGQKIPSLSYSALAYKTVIRTEEQVSIHPFSLCSLQLHRFWKQDRNQPRLHLLLPVPASQSPQLGVSRMRTSCPTAPLPLPSQSHLPRPGCLVLRKSWCTDSILAAWGRSLWSRE